MWRSCPSHLGHKIGVVYGTISKRSRCQGDQKRSKKVQKVQKGERDSEKVPSQLIFAFILNAPPFISFRALRKRSWDDGCRSLA